MKVKTGNLPSFFPGPNRVRLPIRPYWIVAFVLGQNIFAQEQETQIRDRAVEAAMEAMKPLAEEARSDPNLPTYHYVSPGGRLGDMNGPIWRKGWYHLFFQLFPGYDLDHHPAARQHWGHARSRDLVHWEQLPVAIWPSVEKGEDRCFSGTQVIRSDGVPMVFYSSMGHPKGQVWAAEAEDEDLIRWRKIDRNPVLVCDRETHGGIALSEWRDPYIFDVAGQKYLIMGGCRKYFPLARVERGDAWRWELPEPVGAGNPGDDTVPLYRAENAALTRWKFIGFLFDNPDDTVISHDCPLFFEVDGKWVLVLGEHTGVDMNLGSRASYYVGDLDKETMQFRPQFRGRFFAGWGPNVLRDGKGRWVAWSFLGGFHNTRGWRNCMTLPRVLSILPDGRLGQTPAPELEALRGRKFEFPRMDLENEFRILEGLEGDALEIVAEFDIGTAKKCGIRLRCSPEGKGGRGIEFRDLLAKCREAGLIGETGRIKAHIFLDRSVAEIYVNDRSNHAVVLDARPEDVSVTAFAEGGSAKVLSITAWELGSN